MTRAFSVRSAQGRCSASRAASSSVVRDRVTRRWPLRPPGIFPCTSRIHLMVCIPFVLYPWNLKCQGQL